VETHGQRTKIVLVAAHLKNDIARIQVQSEMRSTAILLGEDALVARKVKRFDGYFYG
jgi:hypothetical protein